MFVRRKCFTQKIQHKTNTKQIFTNERENKLKIHKLHRATAESSFRIFNIQPNFRC